MGENPLLTVLPIELIIETPFRENELELIEAFTDELPTMIVDPFAVTALFAEPVMKIGVPSTSHRWSAPLYVQVPLTSVYEVPLAIIYHIHNYHIHIQL